MPKLKIEMYNYSQIKQVPNYQLPPKKKQPNRLNDTIVLFLNTN